MPEPSVPTNGATLHLQKTPCGRGQCPTFRLYVYPNGRVEYVGERNVTRMGTWERRITTTELNALRNRFDQAGFWQLRARYDGSVQDVAGTYLSYAKAGRTKQVLNRDIENPPAAFRQLEGALEALVSSGEWTQPGTPTSPTTTPTSAPDKQPTGTPKTAPDKRETATPTTTPAPTLLNERRPTRRR